jgi:hypothetical protein
MLSHYCCFLDRTHETGRVYSREPSARNTDVTTIELKKFLRVDDFRLWRRSVYNLTQHQVTHVGNMILASERLSDRLPLRFHMIGTSVKLVEFTARCLRKIHYSIISRSMRRKGNIIKLQKIRTEIFMHLCHCPWLWERIFLEISAYVYKTWFRKSCGWQVNIKYVKNFLIKLQIIKILAKLSLLFSPMRLCIYNPYFEEYYLLKYSAMKSVECQSTFQRNISPQSSSEKSVDFQRTTRRYISQGKCST